MKLETHGRAHGSPPLLLVENGKMYSVPHPMMGKGRPAASTSRHQGRGAYSYPRIICAAAVAHGCLYRGAALAVATPLGRPAASMMVAATLVDGAAGGSTRWSSEPDRRELFETPGEGGSKGAGRGMDRDASSRAVDAVFHTSGSGKTASTGATTATASAAADGGSRESTGEVSALGGDGGGFVPAASPRGRGLQRSGPPTNPGGDGEQSADAVGEEGGDEDGDADENEKWFVIISIVVGCGILTLVLLCVVRKVMELCDMRNDPTGNLRYSQEEGLPKRSIERLPQTRYKKPSAGAAGVTAASKKADKKSSGGGKTQEAGAGGEGAAVPEPDGCGPRTATVGEGDGAGAGGGGGQRDSTADMCAICLVEYESGDELRIIPGCEHHFHKDCIDPWLETKAVCAYCKATVEARTTCCDRIIRSASERLGLNLVAPTTIRFSSSRRTYTNEEVQLAMGPTLPAAYGRSDVDYVGSAVAPRQGSTDIEAGGAATAAAERRGGEGVAAAATAGAAATAAAAATGTGVAGAGGGAGLAGSTRSFRGALVIPDQGGPPQEGSIVVQPASAPSYVVVPRDYSLGGSGEFDGDDGRGIGGGGGGGAGPARSSRHLSASSLVRISYDSPRGGRMGSRLGGEEKGEASGERTTHTHVRRRSGVSDGLGGVVFGGDTEEFRQAEEAAARRGRAAGEEGLATSAQATGGLAPRVQDAVS